VPKDTAAFASKVKVTSYNNSKNRKGLHIEYNLQNMGEYKENKTTYNYDERSSAGTS